MTRILLALVLALAGLLGWSLWRTAENGRTADAAAARADTLAAELGDLRAILDAERRRVAGLNEAVAQEQERAREIQDAADRRAADLRAGTVRLRHEIGALYTAQLSAGAAVAGQSDPAAERGAALVAAAIAVGAACDARQKSLIQAYEVNR